MDNIFLFEAQEDQDRNQVKFDKENENKEKQIDDPFIFQENFQEQIQENYKEKIQLEKEQEKQNQINKDIQQCFRNIDNVYLNEKKQIKVEIKKKQNELEKQQQKQKKKQISHVKKQKNNLNCILGVCIKENVEFKLQYIGQKKALKVTDLKNFLFTPLAQYKIRAIIKKTDSGLFNTKTKYSIFIQQNNRFMLSILRDGLTNYIFSLSKENISTKNKNYLGSMVGNLSGTNFILYDNGFNPNQTRSLQFCRKEIASINYQQSKGPRKFQTIISTNCKGFYALEEQVDILKEKWKRNDKESIRKLYSKLPQYDPIDGNYKLDFKGIVKEASVKNFILMSEESSQSLIFGKIDKQTFIMEIKEPFSLYQAAAICISSIHYKLNWS